VAVLFLQKSMCQSSDRPHLRKKRTPGLPVGSEEENEYVRGQKAWNERKSG
jgi:hypothetical protein